MALKPFQGLPLGSLRKNLTLSMAISRFACLFYEFVHAFYELVRGQVVHQPQVLSLSACLIQKYNRGYALDRVLLATASL